MVVGSRGVEDFVFGLSKRVTARGVNVRIVRTLIRGQKYHFPTLSDF